MAEFFMILPQGPNCWMGLGAFSDRVLLLDRWIKYRKRRKKQNRRRRQINKQVSHTYLIFFSYFVSALCTFRFAVLWCHGPFGRTAQSKTTIKTIAENLLSLKMPVVATLECTREREILRGTKQIVNNPRKDDAVGFAKQTHTFSFSLS